MDFPNKITIQGKTYSRDPEVDGLHLQRYDDESLAQMPEHQYPELPKGKRRIRLLVLKSASRETSQIDCELIEADYGNRFHIPTKPEIDSTLTEISSKATSSSSKQPTPASTSTEASSEENESVKSAEVDRVLERQIEYEALSWCWGTGEEVHAIRIEQNREVFKRKIRKELALALRYLRFPDKKRIIWVDSICIDQDNHKERSHQVQMMSRIYTRAKNVCIWLGTDDGDSYAAIKFIKSEVLDFKNLDTIYSDKKYAHKWRALMMLMQRPWFSRRWTIQEISLARTATIHCGPETINWDDFAVAVKLFVEVGNATHRLSEVMKKDEKFLHIPGWFEHVSELGASLLVQATGKVFRTQRMETPARIEESQSIDPLEKRSLLSLQYLVTTMYIFQTSEPRDVIYSLLGVARDAAPSAKDSILSDPQTALLLRTGFSSFLEAKPFEVDYSRAYSDVCRDFVQFSIERTYQVDPVQALDIICRPWALEPPKKKSTRLNQARNTNKRESITLKTSGWEKRNKDGEKEPDDRNMSTYVEDCSKTRKGEDFRMRPWGIADGRVVNLDIKRDDEPSYFQGKLQNIKERHFPKAPNGVSETDDIQRPSWVASARSAPFGLFYHPGSIEKTGRINADPLVGTPQDGYRNYSAAQAQNPNLKAIKFCKRPACDHYSLYVKGFIFDEVDKVRDASQNGFIPASWITLGDWEEPEKNYPPDSFWRTLVGDRGKNNQNPPYYFSRACRESAIKGGLRSGGINTKALIDNEQNSIIAEFCRRVQAVIWNRRLFKTKKGILGLGPSDVKVGDKVGIIYGCTVPVILRQKEKDRGEGGNGKLEYSEEKAQEEFEDSVDALKNCVKRLHENQLRKLQFKKNGTQLNKDEKEAHEKCNKILKERAEAKKAEKNKERAIMEGTSKMATNQREADKEDPYLYYGLIGDSYVHGLMDGEALRRKFYEDIADRTFELR
ncbi:heterokaryon incompatibility protein-domain-containing protein [Xylaria flabelliformis]|nr:heterokaryon incompatibility protein-domain-containing protein [Xylaria flabelliformis]